MTIRALLFLVLVSCHAAGQADIRYDVQDAIKTNRLYYVIERDCTVYSWGGPSDLQYRVDITVWGCTQKSFTYQSEWYETALSSRQYDELEHIVRGVDLAKLTRGKTTCLLGTLTIDGNYHFFNNPLGDPVRDKLHNAMLAYLDKIAPKEKRKITLHTIEGDLEPIRKVTIPDLLANQAKYDGKRVSVTGYYHHEKYASDFSRQQGDDLSQTVWLDDESGFSKPSDIHWTDDGHLTVEGTFMKGPGGRWDAYAGEIQRLTKVIPLDPPALPPPPADQSSKR